MNCWLKFCLHVILAFCMIYYLYFKFGKQEEIEYRINSDKKIF